MLKVCVWDHQITSLENNNRYDGAICPLLMDPFFVCVCVLAVDGEADGGAT